MTPERTDPTTTTEATAASQQARVRRVVAEAARSTRTRPDGWMKATLPRVALAEAASLLAHRSHPRCLPLLTAEPADPDQQARGTVRGTADEHDHSP